MVLKQLVKIGKANMFKTWWVERKNLFFILIFSFILVSDLFINSGRFASFDAPFHITNMAQFYHALQSHDFPVVWNDGEGNYGLPMGIVSHQVTSYLGAVIIALGANPQLAYTWVFFIGVLLSNIFFYFFLRIYFKEKQSLVAIFLFTFTYYKILNTYVRGALPEVFSNMFLALILIALHMIVIQKKRIGFFFLAISTALLALNHPMMLLIYAFIFGPYTLFLLLEENTYSIFKVFTVQNLKLLVAIAVGFLLGLGISGYYLIPLNFEIKYFYFGLANNHLTPNSYLTLINFFDPSWKYFTAQEIFPRGHLVRTGLLEFIIFCMGVGYGAIKFIAKKGKEVPPIVYFAGIVGLLIIGIMTPYATVLFQHINILSNIQFQWRILSAFTFIPPILTAFFFTKYKNNIGIILFILLVSIISFPQIYGKNYTVIPQDIYFFTTENVHDVMMNTIWTGKTEDYPVERQKVAIIDGSGSVHNSIIKNSVRKYSILAQTPLRMVDYTFYFPGWKVYVDGKSVPIEYQDPKYRGVITYSVPQGMHSVLVKFEDTKIRLLGRIVSLLSIGFLAILFIFRKKFAIIN